MSEFLQYFEAELDYVRRALQEFSQRHPQRAEALRISAGRSADPDIQRVADSLALVSARLHKRLDDTRPEISLDLMRMMCPSFLLGAPSYCAVMPDLEVSELDGPIELKKGTLFAFSEGGKTQASFSVARDVSLFPIKVTEVRTDTAPFDYELPSGLRGVGTAICIRIESADGETPLSELQIEEFELYLSSRTNKRSRLCEAFAGGLADVVIAYPTEDHGKSLGKGAFFPTLAHRAKPFLPEFLTQMPSLERLWDFIAYPDKGNFFTLSGLHKALPNSETPSVEIRFFLSGHTAGLEAQGANMGDILLNVVPGINLFEIKSEPTRYTFARDRVPVTPRAKLGEKVEVLRIDQVSKLTIEGEERLPEITSPKRHQSSGLVLWQERLDIGKLDPARREISFSTPDHRSEDAEPFDFVASLLCSNGGAGIGPRPGAAARMDVGALAEIPFVLLEEPTAPISPDLGIKRQWDLISLINGNFGSILESSDPTEALKEVLHLCAPSGFSDAANAIWNVQFSQTIAPIRIGSSALLASGTEVEVVLDLEELPYAPSIFAHVLNDFLGAFVSYDRFVQLSVRARGGEAPLASFERRHGSQMCM